MARGFFWFVETMGHIQTQLQADADKNARTCFPAQKGTPNIFGHHLLPVHCLHLRKEENTNGKVYYSPPRSTAQKQSYAASCREPGVQKRRSSVLSCRCKLHWRLLHYCPCFFSIVQYCQSRIFVRENFHTVRSDWVSYTFCFRT